MAVKRLRYFFFLLLYYSWPNIYHRTWERKNKIFTLGKQKLAKVLQFCIKRRIKQIFYYQIICHLAIPHIGPATGGHLSTRNISQNIRLVHQITECWATNEILQGNHQILFLLSIGDWLQWEISKRKVSILTKGSTIKVADEGNVSHIKNKVGITSWL